MELDRRLDAYPKLFGRYPRNSVSLEHAHMVNRGSGDSHFKVAKYELRGRKIANRMDKILAIMMQDNAYREQAKLKTDPTPTTNQVNQLITSPVEADKIAEAAQREADNIMAIAFPSGPEPLVATIDTVTTQTAQCAPPTAPSTSTVTMGLITWITTEANFTSICDECYPRQPARTNNEPPAHSQHRSGWKHKLLHNTNTGD